MKTDASSDSVVGKARAASAGGRSRTVHISEKGMRLDRFVRIHFPDIPFGRLTSLLKHGAMTVAGRRAKPAERLVAGDVVSVVAQEPARRAVHGERTEAGNPPLLSDAERTFLAAITIHEDGDLLVFDKPPGLAVHGGSGTTRDLDGLLTRMVAPDGDRPVLVHRLDKDTSGLLVAVKRRPLAGVMGKAFATRRVEKEYRAVVAGVPVLEGVIDVAIKKAETSHGGRMVRAEADDPEAQAALTRFRRLAVTPDGAAALVALFPETGRTHQLRVHMALTGHPILGDRIYGDANAAERLMLHAYRLVLPHPREHRVIRLEAPIPPVFLSRFADTLA